MRNLDEHSKRRPKKKATIFKILIFTAIFAVFILAVIRFLNIDEHIFKGPQTVVSLITDSGLESDKGRVNILFLGTGGAGHEGPDLTDTMILASIDKDSKDVVVVSIPRDLWAESINAKINHAYAYGQEKNGEGLKLAKQTVSILLGIPVHYALRVDFNGFIKAVDLVNGLDINVDNAFEDPRYPVAGKEDDLCGLTLEIEEKDGIRREVVKNATGSATPLDQITTENDPFTCRYEIVSFKKGPTYMDGALALKFVRSRYGTNGEGSDFSRSARQQKVILAFRQKVLSSETLTNPKKIIELAQTFGASIDTDIGDKEIPLLAKIGNKIDPATIRRVVLDSSRDESILEVGDPGSYGGQFVLVPKSSWEDLGDFINAELFKLEEK